jgi:hypothetical protein
VGSRWLAIAAGLLALAVPTEAVQARSIPWSLKVEERVQLAQQTRRPLMFWVLGRSASRDDQIEGRQKRAFRDPLVVELASRFVPVRLSRSRYRDLLTKWGLSPRTNLELVFSTPDGERIDTLSPLGVADPEVLARKMALVFQHYRKVLFDQELRPVLEDAETSERDLRAALRVIAEFSILSSDQHVIKLLEREALEAGMRGEVYDTLAALSTTKSVQALLEHAARHDQAVIALAHCTPDGAEQMLSKLSGEYPALRPLVYQAVTRICDIRDVKPERFWRGPHEWIKQKEIERVRELVTKRAQRWRERYAEYR